MTVNRHVWAWLRYYYSYAMHEYNYSQWPTTMYGNDCDTYGRRLRGGYGSMKLTNLHLPSWSLPW